MKKLILFLLCVISLSLGVNAQLRVLSNGHVQIGKFDYLHSITPRTPITGVGGGDPGISIDFPLPDTTANLSIMGPDSYASNGKIVFGGRNDANIREYYYNGIGSLYLTGKGGIALYSGSASSQIMRYKPTSTLDNGETYFYFLKAIKAPEFLTVSDLRCKKDIKSLENHGKDLLELNPVSFTLNLSDVSDVEENISQIQTKKSSSDTDDRRFGFIAQEVREIFPELVKEDEEGFLAVDYLGFIPLLVDAYKNLQAQVAEQQEIIAALTSSPAKTRGVAGIEETYGNDKIVLMQNRPNPFKSTTEIKCHLPQEAKDAFICIYDLNGRQQMRLNLSDRGDVSITVSGSGLQPGMYIYSLIADGQEADTKRMILTE